MIFATDEISGNDATTEVAVQLTNENNRSRAGMVMEAYTACNSIIIFDYGSVTTLESMFQGGNPERKGDIRKFSV